MLTQPSALLWADTGGGSATAAETAHSLCLTYVIGEMTSLEQIPLEQTNILEMLTRHFAAARGSPSLQVYSAGFGECSLTTQCPAIGFEAKFLTDYSFFPQNRMFTGSKYEVLKHSCSSFPIH